MRPPTYSDDDRRQEGERRHFLYTTHVPERRSGRDRRCIESMKVINGDKNGDKVVKV